MLLLGLSLVVICLSFDGSWEDIEVSSDADVSFASGIKRKTCDTTDISIIWVIGMFSCCCCLSDSGVVAMLFLGFHLMQRGL